MKEATTVTRGSQITLTKRVRERLGIREGDKLSLNVEGERIVITKKNAEIFDKVGRFFPDDFDSVMKLMREDSRERLKRLGILK